MDEELIYIDIEDPRVRLQLYVKALEIFKSRQPLPGICCGICTAGLIFASKDKFSISHAYMELGKLNHITYLKSPVSHMSMYPELQAEKPAHLLYDDAFWFDQWEKAPRIEILEKIIKKLSYELSSI